MADALLMFGLGVLALLLGSDSLLKGASGFAQRYGVSPYRCGIAVLGVGSALPPLAIVLRALWTGHPGLAIGTAVGGALATVGLTLGVALAVAPLTLGMRRLPGQAVVALLAIAALALLGFDGRLAATDGAVLLALFAAGQVLLWRRSAEEPAAVQSQFADSQFTQTDAGICELRIAAGLLVMMFGANKAADAAVTLSAHAGAGELTLGLTLVAVGCTLPGLVAAILATLNGRGDVAVGGAVGAFSFNLLVLLGGSALAAPLTLPSHPPGLLSLLAAAAVALFLVVVRPGALLRRPTGIALSAGWLVAVLWLGLRG